MTVADLIEAFEKVDDKSLPIILRSKDDVAFRITNVAVFDTVALPHVALISPMLSDKNKF